MSKTRKTLDWSPVRITFTVTKSEKEALERIAAEQKRSLASLIAYIVFVYLDNK